MQYYPPTTHSSKAKSNSRVPTSVSTTTQPCTETPFTDPILTFYFLKRPTSGFSVEAFHNWLRPQIPHEFIIQKPFDIVPYIVLPLVGLLSLSILAVSYPYIWPILQSKVIWTIASLIIILVFTSGHMWNRIRGAPYTANRQIIAGGFITNSELRLIWLRDFVSFIVPTLPSMSLSQLLPFGSTLISPHADTCILQRHEQTVLSLWLQ